MTFSDLKLRVRALLTPNRVDVDNTIRDVQYALRAFARAPLAAFTIVVTVALGLGLVAVLFTVLNALIFRIDQVPDIGEMYAVERIQLANGEGSRLTRPMFEAMRADTHVFTDAYATVPEVVLYVDGRRMAVTLVTGNFFQVIRIDPVMGRALMPADDALGDAKTTATVTAATVARSRNFTWWTGRWTSRR